MKIEEFLEKLWADYSQIAPNAARLRAKLGEIEPNISNDHIAFRTYDRAPLNLDRLQEHVLALGYKPFQPYDFEEKKLRAFGYTHPEGYPRIFLSELRTKDFSPQLNQVVDDLLAQVESSQAKDISILWGGRPWSSPSVEVYDNLLKESEYAAWVAAFGIRANHFTISINSLETFSDFPSFLTWVEKQGYELNTSGGRIKGSPTVQLEQASTRADVVPVKFADGVVKDIPSCYYEFAKRYPDESGNLYEGFVAASADKIFESTNVNMGN